MAETPESDKDANSRQKPSKLPSPKRGAIPTPKADIEKAKPYIPETNPTDDQSAPDPASPECTEPKKDSQEKLPEEKK